jgi:DNA polymerase III gamma/tau subunit
LFGLAPKEAVDQLYQAVTQGAPNDVVQALDQLQEQGFQAASIAKQLSARLRADLLSGQLALKPAAATALLAKLLQTPAAHQPDSYLELILLEPTLERQPALSKPVSATITEEIKPESVVQISEPATTTEAIKPPVKKTKNVTGSISEAWPTILTTLKQRHNTLYSIVRMAEPAERSDRLVLKFAFPFHQKRLNDAKHQQLLQEVIVEVTGQSIKLDCVVDKEAQPPAIDSEVAAPQPDLALDNISNIFGNTELLD